MTPTRKKRLVLVLTILVGVSLAAFLALQAFQQNLMYFYSPTQVENGEVSEGSKFRIGGLVVAGTVARSSTELSVQFDLTDTKNTISVTYDGILPDLFREGQGIVALGRLNTAGIFVAEEVLAKHDETYMSPEVKQALKEAGHPDHIDQSLVEK